MLLFVSVNLDEAFKSSSTLKQSYLELLIQKCKLNSIDGIILMQDIFNEEQSALLAKAKKLIDSSGIALISSGDSISTGK